MARGGYTENSTEKKVKRNTRGVDSLSKRPAPLIPPSAVPVFFRARRKTTFQTLGSSGAETDLTWNFWENGDPTMFTALDGGGATITNGTDTLRTVRLLLPAMVWISGCISVQTLAGGQLVIVINDGYDNPELVAQPKQVAGSGGDYLFNKSGTYPVLDPTDNPAGEAEFTIDAAQDGGTNRNTLFGTYWHIAAIPTT